MSQALRKLTGVVSKSQHLPDLHQPAAREDRRDVRQPGDHHRRPRAEVLLVGARRHPPHRQHQGRRSGRRRPHARQDRQEQAGAAVPRSRVRHHVRRGHLEGRRPARSRASSKRIVEKSGTWFAYSGERLGQGRENAKQFLKDNRDTFKAIEEKVRKELGLNGAPPAAAEAAEAPVAAATLLPPARPAAQAASDPRRLGRWARTDPPRSRPGRPLGGFRPASCARIRLLSGAPR